MSYNINGKALEELRASTKENPSGIFPKEKSRTSGTTLKNIV